MRHRNYAGIIPRNSSYHVRYREAVKYERSRNIELTKALAIGDADSVDVSHPARSLLYPNFGKHQILNIRCTPI